MGIRTDSFPTKPTTNSHKKNVVIEQRNIIYYWENTRGVWQMKKWHLGLADHSDDNRGFPAVAADSTPDRMAKTHLWLASGKWF